MPASFGLNRPRTAASVTGSAASRFPLTCAKNTFSHVGSVDGETALAPLMQRKDFLNFSCFPIYPFNLPCLIYLTTRTAGVPCSGNFG